MDRRHKKIFVNSERVAIGSFVAQVSVLIKATYGIERERERESAVDEPRALTRFKEARYIETVHCSARNDRVAKCEGQGREEQKERKTRDCVHRTYSNRKSRTDKPVARALLALWPSSVFFFLSRFLFPFISLLRSYVSTILFFRPGL